MIKWFSGDTTSGTLTLKELSGTFQDGEIITDDDGGSASAKWDRDHDLKTGVLF